MLGKRKLHQICERLYTPDKSQSVAKSCHSELNFVIENLRSKNHHMTGTLERGKTISKKGLSCF